MASRHFALGLVVERRRRLVEEQHRRIVIQRARDRDALALPAGQPHAVLADHRLEPRRQALPRLRRAAPASPPPRAALRRWRRRECRTRCCGAASRRADRRPATRSRSAAATRARGLRAARRRSARGRSSAAAVRAARRPACSCRRRSDRRCRSIAPRSIVKEMSSSASGGAALVAERHVLARQRRLQQRPVVLVGPRRRHAQLAHVVVHVADPRMRLAHVADVQHDAVGGRHDAESGIGEQRQHRHDVAAGDVLPHHQEHDDQHAEDQRRFDAEARQRRRPRAPLLGGAELALDVAEALLEERLAAGDLDVLDRAEALLQQVQLLLIQLRARIRRCAPTSGASARSAPAPAPRTIADGDQRDRRRRDDQHERERER